MNWFKSNMHHALVWFCDVFQSSIRHVIYNIINIHININTIYYKTMDIKKRRWITSRNGSWTCVCCYSKLIDISYKDISCVMYHVSWCIMFMFMFSSCIMYISDDMSCELMYIMCCYLVIIWYSWIIWMWISCKKKHIIVHVHVMYIMSCYVSVMSVMCLLCVLVVPMWWYAWFIHQLYVDMYHISYITYHIYMCLVGSWL